MSEGNERDETKAMLEKIDGQLAKHQAALEKAEKGLAAAREKIRNCKKAILEIQKMRSAVIGEKVLAMGFDTPQKLERLYAFAETKKAEEDAPQEETNSADEIREEAML